MAGSTISRARLDGTQQTTLLTRPHGLLNRYALAVDPIGKQLYWVREEYSQETRQETVEIRRANLDGAQVETVTGTHGAYALMVDPDADTLYWVIPQPGHKEEVRQAPLDGGRVEILFSVVLGPYRAFRDFAVVDGYAYWATGGELWRGRVDGSQHTRLIASAEPPGTDAWGVEEFEVDLRGGKLYWVYSLTYEGVHTTEIRRANLDGSQVEILFEGEGETIKGLTLTVSP